MTIRNAKNMKRDDSFNSLSRQLAVGNGTLLLFAFQVLQGKMAQGFTCPKMALAEKAPANKANFFGMEWFSDVAYYVLGRLTANCTLPSWNVTNCT